MDLEVRHLRLIAGIAHAGSVTKAADGLHLTQSALSHQLRDIESRFNTPFFLRVGKRMVLTAAGRRVLESALRILADLERVEEDVRQHRAAAGWRHPRVPRSATPAITGCRRSSPHSAASIHGSSSTSCRTRRISRCKPCSTGALDLAILTNDTSDPRLRLRRLFADEMVALVSRDHRLAIRTWLSPRELAAEHLLLYSSSPDESFVLQRVLRPAGLTPARLSFIMLTEAMIEMARAGLGVAVLPRWSAQAAIASRSLIPLSISRRGIRRYWTAATLKSQPMTPWLEDFIDLSRSGRCQRGVPRAAGQHEQISLVS